MSAESYVYVIMPIGSDRRSSDKKTSICIALQRSGREAKFPSLRLGQCSLQQQEMFDEIRKSECVVADLSHERPSCYYELGVAEAIGKKVHLVAEIGTPIHQCTDQHLVSFYRDVMGLQEILEGTFICSSV